MGINIECKCVYVPLRLFLLGSSSFGVRYFTTGTYHDNSVSPVYSRKQLSIATRVVALGLYQHAFLLAFT